MSKKLLLILASIGLLGACGPRGAVVYGGSSGGGGGQVTTTSTEDGSPGFVVTDDMPEECQELASACSSCDEVEMTRRRILEKKCVRVCEAYVEAGPTFSQNVAPAIDKVLRKKGVCGKSETTCSAIEQSQCAYAMDYTSVGREFLTSWASSSEVPPAKELLGAYYDGVLKPIDGLHRQVFEWGRVNETDVSGLLAEISIILKERHAATMQEVLGEASSQLPPKGQSAEGDQVRQMYKNAKSLSDAIMAPGGSFETYRQSWDVANESFLRSRALTGSGG